MNALVIPLLLGLALTTGMPPPSPSVHLQVERGPQYRLTAVVDPGSAGSGSYTLDVTREGSSGRSVVHQGGAFDARGDVALILSTQSVSASPGDHIRATLVVTWADGQIARDSLDETVGTAPRR